MTNKCPYNQVTIRVDVKQGINNLAVVLSDFLKRMYWECQVGFDMYMYIEFSKWELLISTIFNISVKLFNPENNLYQFTHCLSSYIWYHIQSVNFLSSWEKNKLQRVGMNQPICLFIIKVRRNQMYSFCQLDTVTMAFVSSTISGG